MNKQLPIWIQIPIMVVFFGAVIVFLWGWSKLFLNDIFRHKRAK